MATEIRNALKVGSMVDTYRIEKVLGHGGFGITYLAEDVTLEKKVALKEYLPVGLAVRENDSSVHPRASDVESDYKWGLEQYLREARTLAKFHHPNIVQVLRFFESNGTAYIVMNFVQGQSLHDRMQKRKKISEKELLELLFPLLDGLEKVHEVGFLHRDIKPSNIFVTEDNVPVLLDFGAARAALKDKSRSLTAIVTRGYAPIEQYSSRGKQGPWTDIYALAGVLYEIATRSDPLEATDRVMDDPQTPALEAGAGRLPETILKAIDHALAVKPEHRPQTIAEWRDELTGKKPIPDVAGVAAPAALAAAAPAVAGAGEDDKPAELTATRGKGGAPTALKGDGRAAKRRQGGSKAAAGQTIYPGREGDYEAPMAAAVPPWRQPPIIAAGIGVLVLLVAAGVWAVLPGTQPPVPQVVYDFRNEGIRFREMLRKSAEAPEPAKRTPVQTVKRTPPPNKALKGLIAGSQVAFSRNQGIGQIEARWTFRPGGRLEGAAFETDSGGQDSRSIQDRGRWWIRGSNLCVQWSQWDRRRTRCYAISPVRGKTYVAKGAGILSGTFILEK